METLPDSRPQTALTTTSREPWALAIREQFGDLTNFAVSFSPKVQRYCARNMAKAIEENLPSFGRVVATYGEDGMADLIATHITEAIVRMGEERDTDPCDVDFIASAICESPRFSILRFTTVLGFFHLLKCGEFDIYGKVTPRKILEALRKYAVEALAKEIHLAEEKRHREEEAERERIAAIPAMNWEEKRTKLGVKDATWADYIHRMGIEAAKRRNFPIRLADFATKVSALFSYITMTYLNYNTRVRPAEAAQDKNNPSCV